MGETFTAGGFLFVYVPKRLMCHRIHEEATTAKMLKKSERRAEDIYMFCKILAENR